MNSTSCFHCGLPVLDSTVCSVVINNSTRAMCCPGCQAVAQTIVANGFADYYTTRDGFATTATAHELVPPELRLYDESLYDKSLYENKQINNDSDAQEACYSLQNIRCAACVWLIERHLSRLPGVISAEVNAATERLHIRWQTQVCQPSDILIALRTIGYTAFPFDPVQHSERLERERKKLFRQLFIAGLCMMQVMMYSLPTYLTTDIEADMTQLLRWASLLLTLPALVYSAQPFFRGAWQGINNRLPGMDVPVALGIAAAFAGSSVSTWQGKGDVYFDSVTMFIFLLLCSRYLELTARRQAASKLDKLQHALPASALRMSAWPHTRDTDMIAAAQLKVEDVVLIKPGELVPADCLIVEGASAIDLSLLTGESVPQSRSAGELLPGGAVNMAQPLVARVTHAVELSTLSVLIGLIQRAGLSKPRLALWSDKVAAWFVAALLLFSVVVFCLWQWIDPSRAWPVAIAVLVVSCPCALSLATPTALAAATNRLLREGILVVQPHVTETLQRATHMVFDKTGTLTQGKLTLQAVVPFSDLASAECLRVAAAMEKSSNHPLAQAICEAESKNSTAVVENIRHVTGQGIEAVVDGVAYRLGNRAFVGSVLFPLSHSWERGVTNGKNKNKDATCKQQRQLNEVNNISNTLSPTPLPQAGEGLPRTYEATSVYLSTNQTVVARFDIADTIRPEAFDVVKHFQQQHKTCILLSGDHQEVAQRVADKLGIAMAVGDCLPEDKLAFIQRLQQDGAVVAMTGDGINDAAVLRAADVSFAMGGGAALAQTHADCVLLSGQLSSLREADNIAAKTLAVIKQNLIWATLYNLVAIPAAATGWINPWLSAIGMSLSSVVVVLNALRLR